MNQDLAADAKTCSSPLPPCWMREVGAWFESAEAESLRVFLKQRLRSGAEVYPPKDLWFNALQQTHFADTKVVILGQDPYHGIGQAHGLCFSVQRGVKVPPSLQNIYKELVEDIPGFVAPEHGELTTWASQGVLLLNSSLTVEQGNAGSHAGKGWETLTDCVIEALNQHRQGLVFLLWGSPARRKASFVDRQKHLVLEAPHPSPLSAYRGFFGCRHFSKANEYLQQQGVAPIDWRIP